MKQGDEVVCPHCNKDSFLVRTTTMDGWAFKGEILICSLCKQKIADMYKGNAAASSKNMDKLAALLGEEKGNKQTIKDDGEKQFCRDCDYYISHPFMNRCQLHVKEVNPMDDCHNFTKNSQF